MVRHCSVCCWMPLMICCLELDHYPLIRTVLLCACKCASSITYREFSLIFTITAFLFSLISIFFYTNNPFLRYKWTLTIFSLISPHLRFFFTHAPRVFHNALIVSPLRGSTMSPSRLFFLRDFS